MGRVAAGADTRNRRHKVIADSRGQSGVALAIVVWFVAGMSLLVAGIVSIASVDTRMAQLHVARAKTSAAGDGAINLMLGELVAGGVSPEAAGRTDQGRYTLGDLEVEVRLVPVRGLIDLNGAPRPVLVALFAEAGDLPQVEAELLADNVVNWRQSGSSRASRKNKSSRFTVVEDLLRVEGINRTLVDGIREYVVAGKLGPGVTDWSLSPEPVLNILAKADPRKYDALVRRRETSAGNLPAGEEQTSGPSGAFRADATLSYGSRTWLRRRWMNMTPEGGSVLPWRVVRSEAPRVVAETR